MERDAPPALPAPPRWLGALWAWGPALLALGVGVLGGATGGAPLPWLGLGALAALALGLRTRRPWPALALGLLTVGAATLLSDGAATTLGMLVPVLPLAAVAATAPVARSLAAGAVTAAVLGGATARLVGGPASAADVGALATLCLMLAATGWLIGYALLTRARYAAALEERARWLQERRVADAARAALLERQALARVRHDVVTHNVSVMTVQASAAGAMWDRDPARARDAVEAVERTGRAAMGELRAMLAAMRGDADAPELVARARLAQLDALATRCAAPASTWTWRSTTGWRRSPPPSTCPPTGSCRRR